MIGTGIAGLGAARLLAGEHELIVYEAQAHIGGHAHTVEIDDHGRRVPVDTGFIVYNELNYPNLVRLFAFLGVETEASDMSFSVSLGGGAFEYRSRAAGIVAQPTNVVRPRVWRMLRDFRRFAAAAPDVIAADDPDLTLGELLEREGYSQAFRDDLLVPVTAAIWSSRSDAIGSFPATTVVRFLMNHAMLQIGGRPRWRTVSGGSRAYVTRLIAPFADRIRTSTPVVSVRRGAQEVVVTDATGRREPVDQVVFATPADRTLQILGDDATPEERRLLGAFRYETNRAVLHRDPRWMPRRRGVWASWNHIGARDHARSGHRPVTTTYWMNRLQNLDTVDPVFITLNPDRMPERVVATYDYAHPQFDRTAVRAQRAIDAIAGHHRTWLCGSYLGYGFHEDALRSGLEVARALGCSAPWEVPPARTGSAVPA